MKIAYLCDKKKECNESRSCGTICNHTTDGAHAVNGICLDPEHNDRFEREMGAWIEKLEQEEERS